MHINTWKTIQSCTAYSRIDCPFFKQINKVSIHRISFQQGERCCPGRLVTFFPSDFKGSRRCLGRIAQTDTTKLNSKPFLRLVDILFKIQMKCYRLFQLETAISPFSQRLHSVPCNLNVQDTSKPRPEDTHTHT